MKRTPLRRSRLRSKPTREPAELTLSRKEVQERSGGRCEVGADLRCTQAATEMHHRKRRTHGDHSPDNLIHCCARHHHFFHHQIEISYRRGYLLHSWEDSSKSWTRPFREA